MHPAFLLNKTNTDTELPMKGKTALEHVPSALLDAACIPKKKSKRTVIHSSTISL